MPVKFLTSEQEAQYGHYAGALSTKQLAQYFHLDDGDLMHIKALHEDDTRLGFVTLR